MHVCIVQPWMDYLGGAQVLAHDMALEFKRQGHRVSLITTKFDFNKYSPSYGVFEVGYNGFLNNTLGRLFPGMEFSLWAVLGRVRKKLRDLSPDRVIVKNFPTSWIKGDNVFWYCEEPSFALYPGVVNPIEFQVNPKTGFYFNFLKRFVRLIDKFKTKRIKNRVFANSKRASYLIKEIYNKKAKVINPGVNVKKYDSVKVSLSRVKKNYGIREGTNFLVVSRLHHAKNVMLALKAFRLLKERVSDVSLTVVGSGPELSNLKRFSKHYGLDVKFTGYVSNEEKIGLYQACDVVLYPCLYEPFGLVPIEAMLCKKPVIAINEWGPIETVKHYETGFLVNNNEQEFMKAMLHLKNNTKLREKMGEKGRKRAEKEFTIKIMIEKINQVIS